MAKLSRQQRQLESMQRRQRREAAAAEVMESRMRGLIGYAGAYVASSLLPRFAPSLTQPVGTGELGGTIFDLGLAAGAGYVALTNDGEAGDYAFGAAMVGITQTLDRVVGGIETWLDARAAA